MTSFSSTALGVSPALRENFDLADSYYKARDYDKALEQAHRTLEIDPKYAEAIQVIGWVYEVTENYKGAIERWIKNEQVRENEKRAKELREVFEKSGYPGYLRRDAKDKEAAENHSRPGSPLFRHSASTSGSVPVYPPTYRGKRASLTRKRRPPLEKSGNRRE